MEGVIPRAAQAIFDGCNQMAAGEHPEIESYSIKTSYLEIYEEHVNDLLDASKTDLQAQ